VQTFCLAAAFLWCSSSTLETESLFSSSRSSLSIRDKSVFDRTGNAIEPITYINVIFGRALKELNTKLLGKLLCLFRAHNLFIQHVALVSHKNLVDMDISVLLNLGDPVANGFKRAAISDIIDEEDSLGTTEIGSGNGAEALLAGSVPNLELDASAINIDVLDLEIDPDSGL
jgi:hypothetical protein